MAVALILKFLFIFNDNAEKIKATLSRLRVTVAETSARRAARLLKDNDVRASNQRSLRLK